MNSEKWLNISSFQCFPGGSVVKNPPANADDPRDMGSVPKSGGSPGEGHGNPLQYSCLENSMDRRAWRATVHGVAKNRIWLSAHAHTHTQSQLRHFTSVHQLTYPNAMLPGTSWYQSTKTPVLPRKEKRHWLMERGEKKPKKEIKDWQSQNCYCWIFKSWW